MKTKNIWLLAPCIALLIATACKKPNATVNNTQQNTMDTTIAEPKFASGYATVNDLKMYYEVYGEGEPLVVLHGGGSTIQTTFGRVINTFAKNRKVIGIELQSHGRTEDKDRPFTFEQDADDVAALIAHLGIDSADFFGFSNGGMTTLQIAMRHPKLVKKAVVASAIYKRSGMPDMFWDFMKNASLENMPQPLQQAYKQVAPDTNNLIKMHDKCAHRMASFKDWKDEDLKNILQPVLLISSDADAILPEHTLAMHRLIPNSNLMILPGQHGEFLGEATAPVNPQTTYNATVTIIEGFLNKGR
jgi:pimeloyl-ACP methyl ester carboxylesterase